MSWIAVGVGTASAVTATGVSMAGASRASSATKKQASRFKKYMTAYQGQFATLTAKSMESFDQLSADFDPYDLQNEFDSLYEAIIQPMETDFRENTLPAIRSSYSGGALGSAMFSGGREFTEAQARADLSMNEALLKYNAREAGIQRNFQDYDRRKQDLGLQYEMGTAPIQSAMNMERDLYGAKTDEIAARAARDQTVASGIRTLGETAGTVMGSFSKRPPTPNPLTDAMNPVPISSEPVTAKIRRF